MKLLMFSFGSMNLPSILILLGIVAFVVWDIRYLMKNKSVCGCSGNCSGNCSCHKIQKDLKKAKKDIHAKNKLSA